MGSVSSEKAPTSYECFRPHPVMEKFIATLALSIMAVSVLPWSVPIAARIRIPAVTWSIGVGVHLVLAVAVWWTFRWIPRYYNSVMYGVKDGWLESKGGVVWRHRSRLPVSKVQMVNVMQGPWQRKYGVGNVGIYTAATGQMTAEMTFQNVRNPEAVRNAVLAAMEASKADKR